MVTQTLTTVSTDSLTTEASLDSSSTLTSSQRVDGVTIKTITEMDTTATLSRTSTEDNLQMGLMGSTLRQRIRRCMVITMIKCQLVLRIPSRIATISRTRSLLGLLTTINNGLMINRMNRMVPRALRNKRLMRNMTKCW